MFENCAEDKCRNQEQRKAGGFDEIFRPMALKRIYHCFLVRRKKGAADWSSGLGALGVKGLITSEIRLTLSIQSDHILDAAASAEEQVLITFHREAPGN